MIRLLLVGIFFQQFFFATASASLRGVDSSGGGNELVAYFVQSAHNILDRVEFKSEHHALLQETLKKTRIVSVKVLKNTKGLPVADQDNMVAYGSPGLIQLKEQPKFGDSWQSIVKEKRPAAYIIVHELFRASGAVDTVRSVDDVYQISIGQYRLNQYDNDGVFMQESPDIPYWKCQCFSDLKAGAASAGINLINQDNLAVAEETAKSYCEADLQMPSAVGRCHKYVGDPNSY